MKIAAPQNLRIIVVSDGTGETATAMARAAMTQFNDKEIFFTRYKNIKTTEQIDAIFQEATIHHDMIVYTLVTESLRKHLSDLAKKEHVRCVDLLGPLLSTLSNIFEQEPHYTPGLLHAVNDQYYKRVAAMEFTLNHDDAKNLQTLDAADIILVGISRTSKTPLSIYLSLEGLRVVNIPIVNKNPLPQEVFQTDQRKIFALTIDPETLHEIRKNRLTRLGVTQDKEYANMEMVMEEIDWANKIFAQNRRWPIFNVTNKALEETAAEITKLYQMRQSNMVKQSKRFESES